MQERHINREQYFREQEYTTQKHVIPFIREVYPLSDRTTVLEIGCGEGGNLKPFLDMGCRVTGIDLSESKIRQAREFYHSDSSADRLTLIADDIYHINDPSLKADLIIMRDVIEHIHDQERFMGFVKRFLNTGGMVFFAFPPWYNPFGGHQQVCRNNILSRLPYFHLLPAFLYKGILKAFGENEGTIRNLLEVKETGISIERFQRIIKKERYQIKKVSHYFINPNYEIKFKLKPRKQNGFVVVLPFFRNFLITSSYYLLSVNESSE